MNTVQPRRQFLRNLSLSAASLTLLPRDLSYGNETTAPADAATFFLVSDTHYCANGEDFSKMDETSVAYNVRLVEWLNRLPGTEFSAEAGGGPVPMPHGVIHGGDLVDNGDKGPAKRKMVETEMAAFVGDWGLNGGDGKLRWPVREVHGNHDGPRGETAAVDEIKARNKRRKDLVNISDNGLHYSWDWAGVHFVALGIVVGDAPEVTRKRRYAPLGSLPFLQQDLAEYVGASGRPVVLVHHVDVHRYSTKVPDEVALKHEWDHGDVHAFYRTIQPYRIAATLCGHTHVRSITRWNGSKDARAANGVPVVNTDNAAHFSGPKQAFLHMEVDGKELRVREFSTADGWETGAWTPQVWKMPLAG